jgi:hypothetical protein
VKDGYSNSQVAIQDTAYASLTGISTTLCALRPTGDVLCMGYNSLTTSSYLIYSAITYGLSGGCGIMAATGYASCWYSHICSIIVYFTI